MLLHICYTDQHALQYFDDAWMEMCFSWMAKKDKLTQKYYTDKKESFHFYNGCVIVCSNVVSIEQHLKVND